MTSNIEQTSDGGCEPDFTAARLITDPGEAEDAGEPPFGHTDPVIGVDEHGRAHVLGRFSSDSMASLDVEPRPKTRNPVTRR